MDVKGLSIQQILNMEWEDVQKLSRKDLARITSRLVSSANKRLKRLEQSTLGESPAYRSVKARTGDVRFSVKRKNQGQLQNVFSEAKHFLNLKSSTVKGIKGHNHTYSSRPVRSDGKAYAGSVIVSRVIGYAGYNVRIGNFSRVVVEVLSVRHRCGCSVRVINGVGRIFLVFSDAEISREVIGFAITADALLHKEYGVNVYCCDISVLIIFEGTESVGERLVLRSVCRRGNVTEVCFHVKFVITRPVTVSVNEIRSLKIDKILCCRHIEVDYQIIKFCAA